MSGTALVTEHAEMNTMVPAFVWLTIWQSRTKINNILPACQRLLEHTGGCTVLPHRGYVEVK